MGATEVVRDSDSFYNVVTHDWKHISIPAERYVDVVTSDGYKKIIKVNRDAIDNKSAKIKSKENKWKEDDPLCENQPKIPPKILKETNFLSYCEKLKARMPQLLTKMSCKRFKWAFVDSLGAVFASFEVGSDPLDLITQLSGWALLEMGYHNPSPKKRLNRRMKTLLEIANIINQHLIDIIGDRRVKDIRLGLYDGNKEFFLYCEDLKARAWQVLEKMPTELTKREKIKQFTDKLLPLVPPASCGMAGFLPPDSLKVWNNRWFNDDREKATKRLDDWTKDPQKTWAQVADGLE